MNNQTTSTHEDVFHHYLYKISIGRRILFRQFVNVNFDKNTKLIAELLCVYRYIINKFMNEQEDQFFIEPQVQQLQDIHPVQQPQIVDKPPVQCQESKHIPLKMIEIPKPEINYYYKPFRFQHPKSSQSEEDQGPIDSQSSFANIYSRDKIVYKRHQNEQYQRTNATTYFSGAFLHRSIFLEGNCSQTYELSEAVRPYYSNEITIPMLSEGTLIFDSHFQSGNLFAAFQSGPFQYDLVMQNDVNSTGNNQWFYFSVEGMMPGKGYTFTVVNFTKSDSLFNYGMAPAMYSMAENKGIFGVEKGWKREGDDVIYSKGNIQRQNSRRMFYKLSFKIHTSFEKDKLFIAHSYPYANEKLAKYISDKTSKFKDLVTKIAIGKTLGKRIIQGLMISHQINKKRDNRKAIIIMARQHPGETQGSYVCQGVVQKLLSKSHQADFLLKNYVIYVIPMVNPDGVAFGHYRTNLAGKDLNRKWNATEKDPNTPQISTIKAFLQEVSRQRELRFIIDLHGHSKKLNSFFYGNPCPQNPDVVRIFPYTCSKLHSGIQFLDCTFAAEQYKRKAARVYLSFLYRLVHVYTFQSSFYAYFKDGKKIQFSPKQYRQLGGTLVIALFMQLEHQFRFQQSVDFNKKINSKEYVNSPFTKMIMELRNTKQLLQQGNKNESGSESKPEGNQINNDELQIVKIKPRPISTPSQDVNCSKTVKVSRKGVRQNMNKPIRQMKFLEISRVNSILPDKYQLGLQPIKKKQTTAQVFIRSQRVESRTAECQTNPREQIKQIEFKSVQIQNCVLANSLRVQQPPERKFSSLIRSNNRNIIFKFDIFGQTTSKQEEEKAQKMQSVVRNAYSQTMITYSRQQSQKIRSSQIFPLMESPGREERRWERNKSTRVEATIKTGVRRQAEIIFNGMIKKLINQKQGIRTELINNKPVLQKPLSIKKKEIIHK